MKKLYEEASVRAIADAIRVKTGETCTMKVAEMPAKILAIVTQVIPADLVEYQAWNDKVKAFVENVAYDPADYSASLVNNYTNFANKSLSAYPYGYTVSGVQSGQIITIYHGSVVVMTDTITGTSYTIYNLTPGWEYLYEIKSGSVVTKSGYIKPVGQFRQIKAESVCNLRDLGGWAGQAGTVKYGLIYRSGHFDSISDADKAVMRDVLAIREDIDLRSAADAGTESKLGADILFLDAPMVGYVEDFSRTAQLKSIFTDIFARAAAGEAVVFHCSAGADRTGTIAYITLALLGVSQSDIDKDYEITTMSLSNTQSHRTADAYKSMVTGYIAALPGGNLQAKMVGYFVRTLGFATAEVNAFLADMLTGTPAKYYKVTGNYSNVSSSNSADLITGGSAYSATLTAAASGDLTVTVVMGGVNITSTAYADGAISIPNVTGDIVITATVTATVNYTNLVSSSIDSDGFIYNGTGYLDGKYMSGGLPSSGADANATITGYIQINSTDTIGDVYRIKGVGDPTSSHTRIAICNETFVKITEVNAFLGSAMPSVFTLSTETAPDGTTVYVFTVNAKIYHSYSDAKYFRFSFDGTVGADLVITCNEEI